MFETFIGGPPGHVNRRCDLGVTFGRRELRAIRLDETPEEVSRWRRVSSDVLKIKFSSSNDNRLLMNTRGNGGFPSSPPIAVIFV